MQEYIIALQGISYSDWVKLKAGIDRTFEMQKREFEKNLKLANTDHVKKIIQSGKVMEGVSVEKLSKLTGIPKSTLYQRFSVPEDIRLGELREILKVLKIPEEEKERIGREVI